jgi:hypothetical protein
LPDCGQAGHRVIVDTDIEGLLDLIEELHKVEGVEARAPERGIKKRLARGFRVN